MVLLLSVAATIHPEALRTLWPIFAAGIGTGLGTELVSLRRQNNVQSENMPLPHVFNVGQAFGFAVLLTALTGAITVATERFGRVATELTAGLAALVDLQAPVASLPSLAAWIYRQLNCRSCSP